MDLIKMNTQKMKCTIVTVIANLVLKKSIIPPSDYLPVANFFQDVRRAENEKFILIKKE